jgi:2-iminobutanoate/2-iminopropanoate deaminase
MEKKIIATNKAPKAIGPYNQAVAYNQMLFVSGQIALHPVTGELNQQDIESETKQVLDNLTAILKEAGSSLEKVLKVTIFVKNMQDYAKINAVYATYFSGGNAPARELVEVSALPRYVNIEISAIAAM